MGYEECEVLVSLVVMVLVVLLGRDIGSDSYVNVSNNVGSSIGDYGIEIDVNIGNINAMVGVFFVFCILEDDIK